MGQGYDQGREPLRQQPSSSNHQLSHRISNLSDISDIDSNPYDSPDSHPLRGRESLVSVISDQNLRETADWRDVDIEAQGHAYGSNTAWNGSFGYSGATSNGGRYAPVSKSRGPSRAKSFRGASFGTRIQGVIQERPEDEEAYDLSLLSSAYPMGGSESRYQAVAAEDHPAAAHDPPAVDLSDMFSPTTQHDEAFIRQLQQQEASGTLTGGLGRGFQASSQLRETDLPASPVERSLSRSWSRRKAPSRAESIKAAGQDEANRRGEVIEVIIEEPAGQDLSNMEGPAGFGTADIRNADFQRRQTNAQLFFPQPNWKPFSMRWPWLILLIFLSTALAIMQEILFQKFKKTPILSFRRPEEVDPALYFAVKFFPTLAAVIFGVLWQFTDFEVRRLEAYYQLSKQTGALASESINVDYVTAFNFLRPIRALRLGHYAVALSSIATTLAISLVPTFAAASVVLTPDRQQRQQDPTGLKELHFAAVWSRLLTTTLSICAVMGMGLFYLLQTRRSGLLADVRGIAGLASMAVVSHILMDFKDLDTANPNDIHHKLRHNRYILRNSSLAPDDVNPVADKPKSEVEYKVSTNPHPLMLRPAGNISFAVGLLLFAGFIPVFLFTPASIISEKAAWFITALAVCLKLAWTSMETSVRMMEPFYILSRRHAHSKILTLDYTALPFGYMPIQALLNGHFLVFLVGFGSIMVEFLTILVTGLASVDGEGFLANYDKNSQANPDINSGQETRRSFYTSLGLASFILMYMFIVTVTVFLRRRHPFLPRQPCTIASILAFIHQSKMLYDFVGTEKYTTAEMRGKLDDGKTYGLGWFEGRDGSTHCGVDREELLTKYTHGIDFTRASKPWNQAWDVL